MLLFPGRAEFTTFENLSNQRKSGRSIRYFSRSPSQKSIRCTAQVSGRTIVGRNSLPLVSPMMRDRVIQSPSQWLVVDLDAGGCDAAHSRPSFTTFPPSGPSMPISSSNLSVAFRVGHRWRACPGRVPAYVTQVRRRYRPDRRAESGPTRLSGSIRARPRWSSKERPRSRYPRSTSGLAAPFCGKYPAAPKTPRA